MHTKKIYVVLVALFVLGITVSCNLPFSAKETKDADNVTVQPNVTESDSSSPLDVLGTPNAEPQPFQAGINSLDYYKSNFHYSTSNSNGSSTSSEVTIESSLVDGTSHSVTRNIERAAGETEDEMDSQETYTFGKVSCTYSDGDWSYSEQSDLEKAIADAYSQLMDGVLVVNDPQFIGAETINGVKTNHFSFKPKNVAVASGGQVTQNEGDYWLAVDGDFLVKYIYNLQIQTAPEDNSAAEISKLLINFELTEVNVPITITKPVDCIPE